MIASGFSRSWQTACTWRACSFTLSPYDGLKEYGVQLAAARRHYRAYVEACVLEDDGPLLEVMAASRYAIGGATFVEQSGRASSGVTDASKTKTWTCRDRRWPWRKSTIA